MAEPDNNPLAINWLAFVSLLWSRRKFIAIATMGATIAGIVISLLLPLQFTSTATILPESDNSKLPGGISDLASLAGVNVGGEGGLTKLYPSILKSDAVLRPVIYHKYYSIKKNDSLDLISFWELRNGNQPLNYQLAYQGLSQALEITIDNKLQIVTLKLTESEPQLTADIINQVLKELDRFLRTKRNTTASEQRKFIEGRLAEMRQDLSNSEDRAKEFREKNRVILGSPQLMLEQDRLMRDVTINAALYAELRKQFELIKIEEVKNVPIVNIMDWATAAAKKSFPKRGTIVLSFFFLGGIGAMTYVLYGRYGKEKVAGYLRSIKQNSRKY